MTLLLFSVGPSVSAQTLQSDSKVLRQLMKKIKLDGLNGCIEDAPTPQVLTEPRFTQGTSNVIGIVLPNLDTTAFDPSNVKEPFVITNVRNSGGTQGLPFPRPVTFPASGNTLETVTSLQNGITYFYSTALFLPVCQVNCDAVVDTSQLEIHCSLFSDTTMSIQDTEAPVVQNIEIPQLATGTVSGWLNRSVFEVRAGLSDQAGVWQGFLYRRKCSQTGWNLVADTTFSGVLSSAGFVFKETTATHFVQNLPDGCYEFRIEGKDATHTPESFSPNFQLAGNGGIPADNAAAQLKIQIDTTPPSPVDLTCRQEQNAIFLKWNVSVDPAPGIGLKGYRILKDDVLIATVAGTDSVFVDDFTDVETKENFTYQVEPLDSLGNVQTSGGKAECTFYPGTEVRMIPEPEFTSGNENEVCWTRAANIDSVTLFRAENGDFQNAVQVQVKDTCFTFTALKDGAQYFYWLTSTDRFGRAVLSDTVSSIQDATPPMLTEFDLPEKRTLGEQIWVNRKSVQLRLAAKETAPGQFREIFVFEDGNLRRKIDIAGLHGVLDSTFAYTIQANECAPVKLAMQIFDAAGNASNRLSVDVRVDATPPADVSDATCLQLQNVNGIRIEWSPVSDGENCSGLAGYRILRNNSLLTEVAPTDIHYDDIFSEQQGSETFVYQVQPFDSVGNIQRSGGQVECDYQGLAAIAVASLPEFLPGLESDICWSVSGSLVNLLLFRNEGTDFMKSDSFVVESSAFSNGCKHFSDLKDRQTYVYWLKGTDAQARVTFSDTVFSTQDATLPVVMTCRCRRGNGSTIRSGPTRGMLS